MFHDEVMAASKGAAAKLNFLRDNPFGYFLASCLAGMYIGFGVLLAFTVGGMFSAAVGGKLLMGCSFGIALSLVVIGGAELFTGNNMVMTIGAVRKTVSWSDSVQVWFVCYIGNIVGSIVLALIFVGCGLASGETGTFISSAAATKMGLSPLALVCRGILCNMLVCAAVWCGFRCKSDSGKLIMIFWCLLAFITTGFEHSIANMTLLTVSLLAPAADAAVSLSGWFYNILLVTGGNMLGGIFFIAVPYLAMAKTPRTQKNSAAMKAPGKRQIAS